MHRLKNDHGIKVTLTSWVKLNLFYLGVSKKQHRIFRAKKWNDTLEKIFKKPVYNEKYEVIGQIKDIFGPEKNPFISIKTSEKFDPNNELYTKI
jgi:rRNA processing protein Gar1